MIGSEDCFDNLNAVEYKAERVFAILIRTQFNIFVRGLDEVLGV